MKKIIATLAIAFGLVAASVAISYATTQGMPTAKACSGPGC